MVAKFRNNGQSCIAANRFLMQTPIFDEFVQRFATRIDSMRLGDPVQEPIPDLGPVIDEQRKQAVEAFVAEAEAAGTHRVTRINSVPTSALFVDVPDAVGLARQEVFGPIAEVFPFETEEEAIRRANETDGQRIRIPGERRAELRAKRTRGGIPVDATTRAELEALSADVGIKTLGLVGR